MWTTALIFSHLCVLSFVASCNFYVDKPETIHQEVLHSNKFGKNCVIFFPSTPQRRVNFTISFSQIENTSDSCSTSFIKVYSILGSKRKKRYHACSSSKSAGQYSLASQESTVIMTLQTKFRLKFQYEDMNELSGAGFENQNNEYLPKDSCLQQNKVTCDSTRKCLYNETSLLCNATKLLCISHDQRCNGVFDCPLDDISDEKRCSYPIWRALFLLICVVFSCGTCVFCCHNHHKALKLRNMVRYHGDVIKRKDIVKIKKNKK